MPHIYLIPILFLITIPAMAQSPCEGIVFSKLAGLEKTLDPDINHFLIENGYKKIKWYPGEFTLYPFHEFGDGQYLVNVSQVPNSYADNHLVLIEKQNDVISVMGTFGSYSDLAVQGVAKADLTGDGSDEILVSLYYEHYSILNIYHASAGTWNEVYTVDGASDEFHEFKDLNGDGSCEVIRKETLLEEMVMDMLAIDPQFEHHVVYRWVNGSFEEDEAMTLAIMHDRMVDYQEAMKRVDAMTFEDHQIDAKEYMLNKLRAWLDEIERTKR